MGSAAAAADRGGCRLAGVGPTAAVPDGRRPVRGQPGHAATVRSGLVPPRRPAGRAAAGRGRAAGVTDRWPAVGGRVGGAADRGRGCRPRRPSRRPSAGSPTGSPPTGPRAARRADDDFAGYWATDRPAKRRARPAEQATGESPDDRPRTGAAVPGLLGKDRAEERGDEHPAAARPRSGDAGKRLAGPGGTAAGETPGEERFAGYWARDPGERQGAGRDEPTEVMGPFDVGAWSRDAAASPARPRGTAAPGRGNRAGHRAARTTWRGRAGAAAGSRRTEVVATAARSDRRRTFGDRIRTFLRGIGQTFITLGLVLLLLAGYEVWFTDLINHRTQKDLTTALQDAVGQRRRPHGRHGPDQAGREGPQHPARRRLRADLHPGLRHRLRLHGGRGHRRRRARTRAPATTSTPRCRARSATSRSPGTGSARARRSSTWTSSRPAPRSSSGPSRTGTPTGSSASPAATRTRSRRWASRAGRSSTRPTSAVIAPVPDKPGATADPAAAHARPPATPSSPPGSGWSSTPRWTGRRSRSARAPRRR